MKLSKGRQLRLGIDLIWKERHSKPIRTLFFVLALATLFLTIINHLNTHAWHTVNQQATKAFGADLIVSSSEPIPENIVSNIKQSGAQSLEVLSTLTMASMSDNFQLVSLKAVSNQYPLMGQALVEWENNKIQAVTNNPGLGTVWVEKRLLSQIGAKLGDNLTIGDKSFIISGTIVKDPDAATGILLLAPRVIMNLDDLPATKVVAPGSRVKYAFWLAGDTSAMDAIEQDVIDLDNRNIQVESVKEGNSPLQRVVQYASRYLGLICFLSVVLTGVSISLTTRIWVKDRLTSFAIYRVLGATPRSLVELLMSGLIFWGMLCTALMVCLGIGISAIAVALTQSIYPTGPFHWEIWPTLLSIGIAIFLLVGFSLPEMLLTGKLLPIEILRGKTSRVQALWGFYIAVIVGCIALLYFYIKNATLTLILVAGFGWAAFIGYLLLILFIYLMTKWPWQNLPLRCAIAQLKYRHSESGAQILCLTLALMTVVILSGIQNGFLNQWKSSLPEDAPNHFMINIPVEGIDSMSAMIESDLGQKVPIYPMIRGRVTSINNTLVEDMRGPLPNGLIRALNLSYMAELPAYNPITKGPDWSLDLSGKPLISIEKGFAQRINVDLGDTMSFMIAGKEITGTIYNFREVTWESFKPNFYIIFPPKVIDDLPATAMTSFYIPKDNDKLVVKLREAFPEVTIFDVDALIKEIQSILNVLIDVLKGLVALVMVFALVILYIILGASKDQRKSDASLLKLLGATQGFVQKINLIEFMLLSLITVIMALLGGAWILEALSQRLFGIAFVAPWGSWICGSIICYILLTLFGYVTLKDVGKQSPLRILRQV